MKYTLHDINKAKNEFLKEKQIYDSMPLKDKIYTKQAERVNRLQKKYLKIKSLFFYGNN